MRLKIRLRWSNNGLHYPFVTLVMIGKRSCPGRLTAAAGQACLLGISFGLPPRELPKRDLPVRAVSNTGMRLQREEEDEALFSSLPFLSSFLDSPSSRWIDPNAPDCQLDQMQCTALRFIEPELHSEFEPS